MERICHSIALVAERLYASLARLRAALRNGFGRGCLGCFGFIVLGVLVILAQKLPFVALAGAAILLYYRNEIIDKMYEFEHNSWSRGVIAFAFYTMVIIVGFPAIQTLANRFHKGADREDVVQQEEATEAGVVAIIPEMYRGVWASGIDDCSSIDSRISITKGEIRFPTGGIFDAISSSEGDDNHMTLSGKFYAGFSSQENNVTLAPGSAQDAISVNGDQLVRCSE